MISLRKGAEPDILASNVAAWTKAIVDKLARKDVPTKTEKSRYNHPDIKAALLAETFDKCAYCESKLRHIAFGDIEHVVPKSQDALKWFEWSNLTIACDRCNTNKLDAPIDHENFIDPYIVDPEEHFWWAGSLIFPKPGCDAAALTEQLLELNRAELLERRTERLRGLMKMLEVVERCTSAELQKVLWEDFLKETERDKEYAALARSIALLASMKLNRT